MKWVKPSSDNHEQIKIYWLFSSHSLNTSHQKSLLVNLLPSRWFLLCLSTRSPIFFPTKHQNICIINQKSLVSVFVSARRSRWLSDDLPCQLSNLTFVQNLPTIVSPRVLWNALKSDKFCNTDLWSNDKWFTSGAIFTFYVSSECWIPGWDWSVYK